MDTAEKHYAEIEQVIRVSSICFLVGCIGLTHWAYRRYCQPTYADSFRWWKLVLMVVSACLIPVDVWSDANACAQSIRVDAQQMHGVSERSWAMIITIAVTHLLRVFLAVRSASMEGAEWPKLQGRNLIHLDC